VSCIRTVVETVDMRFKKKTRVGPRNHVLGGGEDFPKGRDNFWELSSIEIH